MTTLTFFGPIQNTAAHTSLARQPADPQLEVSETIPPHITSKGSVRTAPLEHYITLASRDCLQRPTPTAIFRHATEVPPPILRSDQDNRVLIFPGAFNPSHLGHATLLWHIYLSLSSAMIAAIILPMKRTSVSKKKLTQAANRKDRRNFVLIPHQRRQLWQDEVLGRFVWVWPEDRCDRPSEFLRYVQRLAREDGFHVDFPSIHGGDHMRSF